MEKPEEDRANAPIAVPGLSPKTALAALPKPKPKRGAVVNPPSLLIDEPVVVEQLIQLPQSKQAQTNSACGSCGLVLHKTHDRAVLGCGHVYHVQCLFQLQRQLSCYCGLCQEENPGLADPLSDKALATLANKEGGSTTKASLHPLDFGDDRVTAEVLQLRIFMLNSLDRFREQLGEELGEEGQQQQHQHHEEQEQELTHVEQSYTLLDSEIYFAMLQRLEFHNTYLIDPGKSPLTGGGIMSLMKQNVMDLLYARTPFQKLITVHMINIHSLLKAGVTMSMWLSIYTFVELLVLAPQWNHLLEMGFNSTVLSQYRDAISVFLLVRAYKISYADVFTKICGGNFQVFVAMGFSLEELLTLKASVPALISIGLVRSDMARLSFQSELTWQGWQKLGLTVPLMHKLKLTGQLMSTRAMTSQDFAKKYASDQPQPYGLGWTTTPEARQQFLNTFPEARVFFEK